jgi:hypothetical protein
VKATMPRLSVEATLTLNELEIAVLEHFAGYDPRLLVAEISGRFTEEQVKQVFQSMRSELAIVQKRATEARMHLFPQWP